MTEVLSGKELAREIKDEVADSVKQLQASGTDPSLSVVVATADETTDFYVRHITKAALAAGIKADVVRLSTTAMEDELAATLTKLAGDKSVHGIILQTPLPTGVDVERLRSLIPPEKDVDGANPLSAGRLLCGMEAFAPTTALAVMAILDYHDIPVSGTHAVIVGRSLVVGKPLAHLLLAADATVTVCHSKTRELAQVTRKADILVVAIGKAQFITADYIKPDGIVIDVGTNVHDDGSLVGDVDSQSVHEVAGALSPVPGGVGPVTTALLLKQTVEAAKTL
ncbi:MAG TPA: bifunctional 5,10-methylenetetrahydrofolate dehydrogenase/5,10-methenyltetrahydrofolate cyclohydrolase [Candidatus Saccharimonadales bacterium]|nr:bifunctional 5,10-methylenetetrahydrofolate dehydrogenase/5,10-methenyltetrahydrofolate cyclohydrolase [Candidatus Saccharimonadales bacterium]